MPHEKLVPGRLRTPREVGELSSPPNWHFERSQVRLGPWFVGKTGPAVGRRLTWRRSFVAFTQLMRSAEESGVTGEKFFWYESNRCELSVVGGQLIKRSPIQPFKSESLRVRKGSLLPLCLDGTQSSGSKLPFLTPETPARPVPCSSTAYHCNRPLSIDPVPSCLYPQLHLVPFPTRRTVTPCQTTLRIY